MTGDDIYVLKSAESATKVPNFFVPKTMHNEGNYIISWATSAAGWPSRPKDWAWRSTRASPPRKR